VGQQLLAEIRGLEWTESDRDSADLSARRAGERIRIFRAVLRAEPRNALRWIDLGREYLATGKDDSARNAVAIALQLAPKNRFVLRSAVHLYTHLDELDRARFLVSDRDVLADPWLMAVHVALAPDKGPRHLRSARLLLESSGFDPWHLGELAAGLATLELTAGRHRQGRALMRQALLAPTDNVAAQAEWATRLGSDEPDPSTVDRVSRPDEALSRRAAHEFEWTEAARHGALWLADQPFSVDAALSSSSHAIHARSNELARDLADRALAANPNHPGLLNNRGFARARLGDLAGAAQDLIRARRQPADAGSRACAAATEGFILFRAGDPEGGRRRYQLSVESFIKHRQIDRAAQAAINLALEETRLGLPDASESWTRAAALVARDGEPLTAHLLAAARVLAHPSAQKFFNVSQLAEPVRELWREPPLLEG
jgi:Tfp pilus assembly protein PilF